MLLHFQQICIEKIVFGGSRGFETYCRDETDPIELSGGSNFVGKSPLPPNLDSGRFQAGFRPGCGRVPAGFRQSA